MRAPKYHLALVEVCAPGQVLPPTPSKHGLSHHPDRSQAEIPRKSSPASSKGFVQPELETWGLESLSTTCK